MSKNLFEQNLNQPENLAPEAKELNEINEKEYLAKVKKQNKKYLIKLDYLERERIAKHIKDLYLQNKDNQKIIEDNVDLYDEVYRMVRDNTIDSDINYRSPLSTVTLEVIHSNIMNVFFTPKDIMRVLPTEANDIPKIKKLDIFGNWSVKNELEIFEKCDRLFHSSAKNGECPYYMTWAKEYGTETVIDTIPDPMNPGDVLLDPDTKEPIMQEREVSKLLYNGPKFEIFSRKDYILPKNAMIGKKPDWEMRKLRLNADKVRRKEDEGKYYDGCFEEIGGWGADSLTSNDNSAKDKEGSEIPLGKTEKLFVEFYGTMRINAIKNDEQGEEAYEELEDEFIGVMELNSETLCQFRKNKFPLKLRPCGLDLFIPNDDGSLGGIGVIEFMQGIQQSYDGLANQYQFGTIQANNPTIFFSPTGNKRDEPIKIKSGWAYPTSDPNSIKEIKFSPPDVSLLKMMELVRNYAQLLFGIGDYQAGLESQIDPTAPAKKAEIVVAQGNVRLNLIIKRKNQTLKDIFKRWFLLYQANMPSNKFMRIAGDEANSPWKFEKINLTDFALNSIPDFELTGNILNANKTLEFQKRLGIYQAMIANFFFMPNTQQGLQSLHALTKWFLDSADETGVSSFLPPVQGDNVLTPEEENARFLQGDTGEISERDDDVNHIKKHSELLLDPTVPEEVKKEAIRHIGLHTESLKKKITLQMVAQMQPQGGMNGQPAGAGAPPAAGGVFQGAGMGRPQAGSFGMPQ